MTDQHLSSTQKPFTAIQTVKFEFADTTSLGLFGLAMVTLVASTQKLGFTNGYSFVVPWAIFLGACAQLFASWGDLQKNNTFGMTAFGAFGLFWLAVALSWLFRFGIAGQQLTSAIDERQLGVAFIGYLIFSLFMTIGAININRVFLMIFILVDLLFIGLGCSTLGLAPDITLKVAGVSELLISLLSFYGSAASVLNLHFGKVILPLGKPIEIFK